MNYESSHKRLQQNFFFLLILAAIAVTFMIFRPFFAPLVLALSLGITFMPVHRRIRRAFGKWSSIAALVSTATVILVVLLPLALISYFLFNEAAGLYLSVSSNSIPSIATMTLHVNSAIHRFVPGYSVDIPAYLQSVLEWFVLHLGVLFSEFFSIFLETMLLLLTLFYFFKSGGIFRRRVSELSPLANEYDKKIFDRLALAVSSIIRGSIIVAVLQGTLATFGVWIFGLPSPLIWGVCAGLASFVPGVGTLIVMGPAIIWLAVFGNVWHALGLLVWYACSVALVDNILSPLIIERGMKIHSLFILVSILGGLVMFGPIGFLLGPIVLAFLFALLDIYPLVVGTDKNQESSTSS